MLKQVLIQNFVLIDSLTLDFENGFSAFTGETGAGKSILIDAISLLCGARASTDYIRHGETKALIEGVFELTQPHPADALLQEYGFELEDNLLIVTREIHSDGRSIARLQHRQCSLNILKEIMTSLVDIHSQHDNHYLLDPKNYLTLLDRFDGSDTSLKDEYVKAYQEYAKTKREYETFLKEQLQEADLDILVHQRDEILQLDLRPKEKEELEERARLLGNMEKIRTKTAAALELLHGDGAIIDHLYEAKQILLGIHETDMFEESARQLESLYYQVADIGDTVKEIMGELELDDEELNHIHQRLFTIQRMLRKYGGTEDAMMRRFQEIEAQINRIEHRQEYIDEMEAKIGRLQERAQKLALALSEQRQAKAARLEKAIAHQLKDLYLPNARFSIVFHPTELTAKGMDQVSFLVAMNKGEQPKPLDKTASGGEISRFMLGLKVIFTKLEQIRTVIFDEIDTGISGPTAFAIGRKMRQLASDAQVFSVTHLAQVAASAHHQYLIEKQDQEETTTSSIQRLDDQSRIRALALLSSGNVSETSLKAAQELFAMAWQE